MITFDTISEAAKRISSHAVKTPLLESPLLNEKLGGRLFLKCEMLQKTGSFKFRGAYNSLSCLSRQQLETGVFAYSSGNHAQGVAYAAKLLGCKATILMPEDTPSIKLENTRKYGATVLTYDRYTESREEIGSQIAKEQNLTLIKPYDYEPVIAGQGTIGIEVVDQLQDQGLEPDVYITPCGGGGLLAGSSVALHQRSPNTEIYSAEPEYFDDTARSLELGERVANSGDHRSICDAIVTPMPGEITFPILQKHVSGGIYVSEEEVRSAVYSAYNLFKVVIEPGGAVALASILSGKVDISGKVAVAVGSGGNIDPELFASILRNE
ncbi:pyridoxal-phosphate dependent enzyme [Sneathiella sp. P13V-1]|uniref:threonine ammonia-lyase n=1 Tax=Sneathiella sp. P13V-1 TaxID=2697366 RepID=UPI00187B7C74|nr:threonine/serine dehydratase [Sneathiella sp. P13V-1]MBE7638318.1 pyridoxal-phosphate dependent enzyme [Sneathiella sp. P13V-1]